MPALMGACGVCGADQELTTGMCVAEPMSSGNSLKKEKVLRHDIFQTKKQNNVVYYFYFTCDQG